MDRANATVLIIGADRITAKVEDILTRTVCSRVRLSDVQRMASWRLRRFDAIIICHEPRVAARNRAVEGTDRLEQLYVTLDDLNRRIGGSNGRYLIYTFGVPVYPRDLPLEGRKSIVYDLDASRLKNVLHWLINPVTE